MEITGRIIAVLPAASGTSARTGNPWMSQEYVLETHDQYPRKCCFRVFGEDRIKQFNIQAGEEITVSFDIDAREYNGRWFNSINAWAVNRNVQAQAASQDGAAAQPFMAQQPAQAAPSETPFPPAQDNSGEGSADDLPF
ncbi:MAG: DUF3127 domain-containing protein [Prevotella sp.]|nr:DUF3127 domain-containing protein [Prevotella sp.]